VAFDDSVDMAQLARYAMEFCATESCGKCTPCRIGSTRGVEVIDRIIAGDNRDANLDLLAASATPCSTVPVRPRRHGPVSGAVRPDPFPEDFGIAPVTAE
jgi:formate dehydrogenase iron-sulfur subunit